MAQEAKNHDDWQDNAINVMSKKLDKISDKIEGINVKIAGIPLEVMEMNDKRYAKKWVADAMKFILGGIGTGVLGAISKLVLK